MLFLATFFPGNYDDEDDFKDVEAPFDFFTVSFWTVAQRVLD